MNDLDKAVLGSSIANSLKIIAEELTKLRELEESREHGADSPHFATLYAAYAKSQAEVAQLKQEIKDIDKKKKRFWFW